MQYQLNFVTPKEIKMCLQNDPKNTCLGHDSKYCTEDPNSKAIAYLVKIFITHSTIPGCISTKKYLQRVKEYIVNGFERKIDTISAFLGVKAALLPAELMCKLK